MLQQTRVGTVLGYYHRFLQHFPDLPALAAAKIETVLQLWAGLGYYARARQAHRCARTIIEQHGALFPRTAQQLAQLPGIGPSTAAAIAAFCFHERAAILDGNVKRVLARRHAIDGDPKRGDTNALLWRTARALLPEARHMGTYTQAIMDLGASICTRSKPRCDCCPVSAGCLARAQGRTAELPTRAVPRMRPMRSAHMLVVLHRRAVLLEQRAATGIWGGLLSVPQFSGRPDLKRYARRYSAEIPTALAERRHRFTHFTLVYTPHLIAATSRQRPSLADGQRWLALSDIDDAALPAPILALLRELRDGATRRRARGAPASKRRPRKVRAQS
jgi:A/G-specific adenine glycosylase